MKKVVCSCLPLWIVLTGLLFLTGCTMHITKDISKKLDAGELYKSYNVTPEDLSLLSKCDSPPTIKIVNVESRIDDFEVMQNPPLATGVVNPKEMMDVVTSYLENGFKQSHIKVDDRSSKVLQIKMSDLKSVAGVWSFGSFFKLWLTIPETGFAKSYEAKDNAISGHTAPAYAIHSVTRQIIDDPSIQDYILCRAEYKDQRKEAATSKSLNQKLQELQSALDRGFVTTEEYQLKRKEILEKY